MIKTKLRILLCSLLFYGVISFLTPGVHAETAGLLRGKIPSNVVTGSSTNPGNFSDGNVFTFGTIDLSQGVEWDLGSVYDITEYYMKADFTNEVIKFYDSNHVQVGLTNGYSYTANNAQTPIWTALSVSSRPFAVRYARLSSGGSFGHKVYELDVRGIDNYAPAVPSNLSVTPGDAKLTLDWDANISETDLAGYYVWLDGAKQSSLYTSSHVQLLGLTNGHNYSIQVTSVDTTGNQSAKSQIVFATPFPTIVKPDVSVTATKYNLVTLGWNDLGVSNYEVWDYSDVSNPVKVGLPSSNKFMVSNLHPSTTYSYVIVYTDSFGRRVSSDQVNARTNDLPSPQKPVVVSSSDFNSVTLSWTDLGAVSYDVFQLVNGSGVKLKTLSALTYTVTGLTPSTPYTFYISYVDSVDRVIVSDNVLISTTTPPPLTKPTIRYTATATDISFSWDNTAVSYDVFFDNVMVGTQSDYHYTVTGLLPVTTHNFYLKLHDSYGQTLDSNKLTAVTASAPAPYKPQLTVLSKTDTRANLNWNDAKALSYDVMLNDVLFQNVQGTVFGLTGLSPSTSYKIAVVSHDAYGRATSSDPVFFTTLAPPPPPPVYSNNPPPKVATSSNDDLNNASDKLVQGVKDTHNDGMIITVLIILLFIVVFGTSWFLKITKKKLSKTAARSPPAGSGRGGASSTVGQSGAKALSNRYKSASSFQKKSSFKRRQQYHVEKNRFEGSKKRKNR